MNCLKYKPFFIKPNKEELEETFNTKIETKEEIIIRFRSVICIYMQSCRFWAGGNNIQCMYVANDDYITELQNKQNQNQELYSGSRLANGDRFIPVGMEINSGDELVICCEELEVI